MAVVSGRLIFDKERTAAAQPWLPGIANVPIVLQNVDTGEKQTVLTDANGNYSFSNVADGNYHIVESYGEQGKAAFPPITFAKDPPAGATNLDATTRTTIPVTVANGADVTNQNILNGPVTYTPIASVSGDCTVVEPSNLIKAAAAGSFGTYPEGTQANTGASPNPYPEIGSDFGYVLPSTLGVVPADGAYTIQNIMTNAVANEQMTWWRVSDHTAGDETGRMMVVNGSVPQSVFFQEKVNVTPNTYYLLSAWILNLVKDKNLVDPALGVKVLGADGSVLYSATLGVLIPMNENNPEWKQMGTAIHSQGNSSLTVQFISMGPAANGNDYVIDDIALNKIDIPVFTPIKAVDKPSALLGETVTYTVTISNTCKTPVTVINFKDVIPEGLTFLPSTVTVNGTQYADANPNTGFTIPDIVGGERATIKFSARADSVPTVNPTINRAKISYIYTPVEGGITFPFDLTSNDATVKINYAADLSIIKTADQSTVKAGSILTYKMVVENHGPDAAEKVTVTDNVPAGVANPEVSADNGATWSKWVSPYAVGTVAKGTSKTILVRGTASGDKETTVINTATVGSSTLDLNLNNNTSSVQAIIKPLSSDVAVTKTANAQNVKVGHILTYTITLKNNGPDAAEDVVVTDNVPSNLSNVQFSTDGGVTWNKWVSSYAAGTIANGASKTILIRGTVSRK